MGRGQVRLTSKANCTSGKGGGSRSERRRPFGTAVHWTTSTRSRVGHSLPDRLGTRPEVTVWPLIEIAVEPRSKADSEKLGVALQKLLAQDAAFTVSIDPESGRTILGGMNELPGQCGAPRVMTVPAAPSELK